MRRVAARKRREKRFSQPSPSDDVGLTIVAKNSPAGEEMLRAGPGGLISPRFWDREIDHVGGLEPVETPGLATSCGPTLISYEGGASAGSWTYAEVVAETLVHAGLVI